jgi:2-methylcitrate dehydratase PrpD
MTPSHRIDDTLVSFTSGLQLADVPASARQRATLLLADMAAVCAGGRGAPAARLALDHAQALHPADEATALLDSTRVGAVGAAFANGVLANVLDFDDGHRLTKGHPGAVIIPATLAVAQLVDASAEQFLLAVIVGYEIAIRAGIALHARDDAYHASGAWGAVGAAAAAARLLELESASTVAAIGLAEYHAPIAPIMRSCAEPAMTKDACAWGASVGVSSALLAARGFTSVRAEFLDSFLGDLGTRWRLEELYIKAYPCCRWSQGAIAAALAARSRGMVDVHAVERVRVRTFEAADGLAKVIPANTEEAQYNLAWPVACALVRGDFSVADVLGPFDDPSVEEVFSRVEIEVDPDFTAAFPARRLTAVEIELRDGRVLAAGPVEAPGEPDDPRLPDLVAEKVGKLIEPERDLAPLPAGSGLRAAGAAELLGLLCNATPATTRV